MPILLGADAHPLAVPPGGVTVPAVEQLAALLEHARVDVAEAQDAPKALAGRRGVPARRRDEHAVPVTLGDGVAVEVEELAVRAGVVHRPLLARQPRPHNRLGHLTHFLLSLAPSWGERVISQVAHGCKDYFLDGAG